MNATDVLLTWLGSTDLTADPPPTVRARWFAVDPAFDQSLRERFGALLDDPARLDAWTPSPVGLVAAILVLDQLSRNIHRGEARAFAGDAQARALAELALRRKLDRRCSLYVRAFLYLPFEHAEDLALQDRAVALFEQLVADTPAERQEEARGLLGFAERHRAIIQQFGRFPGRNRALGRADTPEEAAWLASGGETFGQGASKR